MQPPVHNEPGMKEMKGNRFAPPNAAAMMEALRGLGYSTATALADVIDNSLAAGATEVHIRFEWHGINSRVSILDNGVGMTDPELRSWKVRTGAQDCILFPMQEADSGFTQERRDARLLAVGS